MIALLIHFLNFITSAYAGTGGPADAEISILLLISFLALILLFLILFKFYRQWKADIKKKRLFGNHLDYQENEDEMELFQE